MGSRKASRTHTPAGHRAPGRRSGGRLLAGAAAFGVLTVAVVAALVRGTVADSPDQANQASESLVGTPEASASDAATGGARACRDQVAAAGVLVSAARTGIAHLETQVGAHQAWAAGDLDEESRDAQLRSTTLAGPDDLERYADAERDYEDLLDGSGDSCTNRSGSCPGRMQALRESMEAATDAMDLWEERLGQLADVEEGALDQDSADDLWSAVRVDLPGSTSRWRAAERGLERAPTCA